MNTSAFEILGPIMVGPSSSHTAGALRIALVARSLAPEPIARAEIVLYNSFARTHKGHGTDQALVAGLLGMAPDDIRVRDSLALAKEAGLVVDFVEGPDGVMEHPNTVSIAMQCVGGATVEVCGESLGGGRIRISSINGVHVEITGDYPTLFVSHYDRPGVLASLTGALSSASVNIATMRTFRQSKGGRAYTVFETDEPAPEELIDTAVSHPSIIFASLVIIPGADGVAPDTKLEAGFSTGAQLLELCESRHASIGDVMRDREAEISGSLESADAEMAHVLSVMHDEVKDTIERPRRSLGGFLNGQASLVWNAGPSLMGPCLTHATAYAMAVLERSASMGVIVAAPTAGSSGIVPGALIAAAEALGKTDEDVQRALWTSAAIGAIVAHNASVAGAEGGCQAEVGTAAAMAAGALVELMGGSPRTALDAATTAIVELLGIVCDPIQGLVEYPCQNRNALGVAVALSSAQLALAGVNGPIPFDEAVDAMKRVGHALPSTLRETALGGLAAEPSAAKPGCFGCASCL